MEEAGEQRPLSFRRKTVSDCTVSVLCLTVLSVEPSAFRISILRLLQTTYVLAMSDH
jgi:hypothetical protein